MRKALLLLVVLAGFAAGCENKYKDPDPEVMGQEYYPLEVGDYRIYDVTDIRFSYDKGDTSRFQMRERVDTSFYDQTNTLVFKIIRSVRPNASREWVDDSVMVVSKSEKMVLLTKDNNKFVKLVFPVKEGLTFIGNAFNNIEKSTSSPNSKEKYLYSNVGAPFEVKGQKYENTATVIQGTPVNDVQVKERKEVYSKGVGLVYRLFNRIVYCEGSELRDCPMGENFKHSGHERHEVLIANGKL